jgi:hypothetical protein
MDFGLRQEFSEQEYGEAMAASFKDELEKLSAEKKDKRSPLLPALGAAYGGIRGASEALAGGRAAAPTRHTVGRAVARGARGAALGGIVGYGLRELASPRFSQRTKKSSADLQPPSAYGRGEDGAPGLKEQLEGAQAAVERKAEEARLVGEPRSDKLQKVLLRLQGTSGESEVAVRALQTKAAEVSKRRAALTGALAGAGAGAAGEALKRRSIAAKHMQSTKYLGGHLSPKLMKAYLGRVRARKLKGAVGVGALLGGTAAILASRNKTSQAQTLPVTREDVMAAAGRARRRKALGTLAGTAGGAALGTLLRPRGAGAALGALGGMVAGGATGQAMAGTTFRKELMRRARARREATKTAAVSSVGYSKYFRHKMHTRGITSPTQLSGAQKKNFFEGVDKGWHSSHEKFQKLKDKMPRG